jgi:hypothetical protein
MGATMDLDHMERLLAGTWRHAHEEDTPSQTVFRLASVKLPPARGRTGFELRPDHSGAHIGIAKHDGSLATACSWKLQAGSLPVLVLTPESGPEQRLPIVSLDSDRLVVQKPVA